MVTPPSLSPISQNMNSCFVNRQHINPLSTFAGATVSEPSTIQQQSFLATVRRLSPLTKVRNKAQQERLVKSVLLLSNYGLFQPTRPVQGVTLLNFHFSFAKLFQPTRPVRDVTVNTEEDVPYRWFQPTRPVRGVTLVIRIPFSIMAFKLLIAKRNS